MPPGFASRQDILTWADANRASAGELPRLVRRLILETAPGVSAIDFPAAEGIATPGFDGMSVASTGTPFVPAGQAVWELSVDTRPGTKATRDYKSRAGDADPETTYVALNPRRWRTRSWAQARSEEGVWKEVRAYGIDQVETWLESAPVTHAWLSEELGLHPHGMRTGPRWWSHWSAATAPELSRELVLAGRASAVETLHARLAAAPGVTTISANSLDEATAFAVGAVLGTADTAPAGVFARAAVVDDVAAWRRIAAHGRELILITDSVAVAAEAHGAPGHHVIVPLVEGRADIQLDPIRPDKARECLEAAGCDESELDDLAVLAARSLLALRRRLAKNPELHSPPWARAPVPRVVRSATLAGSWADGVDGDQDALAELAGKLYEELSEELLGVAAAADPLLTRYEGTWKITSPYDALSQLAPAFEHRDLTRFRALAEAALLEHDPATELPPDERWRAGFEGKRRTRSDALREGCATTIALLGTLGDEIRPAGGPDGATTAAAIVRTVLDAANADQSSRRWIALGEALPPLAEGAPDAFLDAVRAGCAGHDPVLRGIFEGGDPLMARASHSELLWALEHLAWSPDHFGQVIDLLARLAEIDPGGRLVNRPARSLETILCPWHPETTASVAERLDVVDGLRTRHAGVAWPLMLALLPDSHTTHVGTSRPRFRRWRPARVSVTMADWHDFVTALVTRLIEDAGADAERWKALLEQTEQVTREDRARVREALAALLGEERFDDPGRGLLWETLRALVARHREFASTDWALPTEDVDELDALAARLAPDDPVARVAWLFEDELPDLGEGAKLGDGYEAYRAELDRRRDEALRAVAEPGGWDGVLALAERSGAAFLVGASLGAIDDGRFGTDALAVLDRETTNDAALGAGYARVRISTGGWDWIEAQLAEDGVTPRQTARLLGLAGDHVRAWQRADELGAEVAEMYWAEFTPFGLGAEFPAPEVAARRLVDAGRPGTAIQLLSLYARKQVAGAELASIAADALEAVLASGDEQWAGAVREYGLQHLIALLEDQREALGVERVARIEWAYLPALGHEPEVPSLHEALASEPSFFVDIVSLVYKPRSGPPPESTQQSQAMARNAYELLRSWRRVPGSGEGGVDGEALAVWVREALDLLQAADRREVGELQIGHVLARAPGDADGTWPCLAVRELLEESQSERIERGLAMQKYDDRGVTTRDPTEGGDGERALAQSYREQAKALATRWPRTAAVLRELAGDYERDARGHDEDARRWREGSG